MANYSYEKGKHGGTAGMIFPYFRTINGLLPLDQDYRDYIPAGFLRCRGQVLQADQFPQLAELFGVGSSCIYRKEGTVLQERNNSGTGGTFQLPDLGSKFVTTSSNSGNYLNDTTIDISTNNTISRAGIAVIMTVAAETLEFTYTGSFKAPAVTLSFSGGWRLVSPPSETEETSLTINNFVAHGHYSSHAIGSRVNTNSKAYKTGTDEWAGSKFWWRPCLQRGKGACAINYVVGKAGVAHRFLNFNESGTDESHSHPIPTPSVFASGPFSTIPSVDIPASNIVTTITLRVRNVSKMDNIAPKFILCEYLVKF